MFLPFVSASFFDKAGTLILFLGLVCMFRRKAPEVVAFGVVFRAGAGLSSGLRVFALLVHLRLL